LNNNNAALRAIGATADQVAASGQLTAQKFGLSWGQQSASVAGSFAEIASSFGTNNKKMAKAAQIFGAVQALISTYAGAAKALELPFPYNLAAVAVVMAKGFSLVAAIKGANVPSAAAGGAFTVPGGVSMTDNKMIPMHLAAGERVKVESNHDKVNGDGVTTVPINVYGESFGRDTLSRMVDGMNGLLRDRGVQFAFKPV
jgi:hypothetical protein